MTEQMATIRNGGAERLRAVVLRRAAAFLSAVAVAAALALILAGEPAPVRAAAAVLAIFAVALAGLLVRAVLEYLRTPTTIEFSAIILLVKYARKEFIGLSWSEITSILPVKTRFMLMGGPLYDLKLSVILKKDEVVMNLSLKAARMLIAAYQQNAKKVSPDEAEKIADGCFDIKRY